MEFIVIVSLVAGVIWIAWRARAKSLAAKESALNRAWHEVLDDPQYLHRRRYEERMREDKERVRRDEGL